MASSASKQPKLPSIPRLQFLKPKTTLVLVTNSEPGNWYEIGDIVYVTIPPTRFAPDGFDWEFEAYPCFDNAYACVQTKDCRLLTPLEILLLASCLTAS
jgi:hypothetical protein